MRSSNRRPRRKLHGCITAITVLLTIGVLLLLGTPSVLRHMLLRGLSPDELERLEVFNSVPVHLPPDWQEVKPVSPELVQLVRNFRTTFDLQENCLYALLGDPHLNTALGSLAEGKQPADEAWTTMTLIHDCYLPIHNTAHDLVQHPQYAVQELDLNTGPEILLLAILRKAARSSAFVAKRAGETTHSISLLLTAFRLGNNSGEPVSIYYEKATNWRSSILQSIARILSDESTTVTLEKTLQILNEEEISLRSYPLEVRLAAPFIYEIRKRAKDGFAVNLTPGKTGRGYLQEMNRTMLEHPGWMLRQLPLNDSRREDLQAQIEEQGSLSKLEPDWLTNYYQQSFGWDVYFLKDIWPDFDRIEETRKVTRAYYDLVRLHIAQQLMRLRDAEPHIHMEWKFLPDAGDGPLPDPYSRRGEPYNYDSRRGHFYSIGKNGTDDHQTSRGLALEEYTGDDLFALKPPS